MVATTATSSTEKKWWSIAEVCVRLGVGKSFVYALIEKGMLERKDLPSPNGKKREGLARISVESLHRYERGEVVAPQLAVKKRVAAVRAKSRPPAPTTTLPGVAGVLHFR